MANMIGRLGVVLGLDSAEFVRGIDGASKRLDAFAENAVASGKVAAAALVAASVAALKYADDIYDVAKANDVAVDSIVKLKVALSQSGGQAQDASKFMSSFTMYVDKAATGTFEAQKNFAKLGISLKDIGSLSMDKIFAKTVESIAQINDPVTRNAKAIEMFGKAAKGVDMIGFAEEMANAAKVSQETAKSIEQAGKFFDLMDKMAHKAGMTLTEVLAPPLKIINSLLDGFLNKNVSLIDSIHDAYNLLAPGMIRERQPLYMKKTPGGQRITPFEMPDEQLRETELGVDPKQQAALAKQQTALAKIAKEIKDRQEYHNKLIEENIKKNKELYDKEWNALTKKYTLLEDIQKQQDSADLSLKQQQRMQLNQLDYDRQILLLKTQNKDLQAYELKYAQDIITIRAQYLEQEHQINSNEALGEEYKRQALEQNIVLRDRSIAQAREVLDIAKQESEGSFQKGFGKGFDEFVRNMPNQLELGRQTFNTLMSSMESALQNFVRTGKFSFKDFARSLIQDMIMIQARAQMMSMMKGIWSMFGGGTPSVNLGYGGGSSGAVGISGFADGGSPPVGRASLVGERGPELFVPRTAGTIIPNNQLANAMGGGQTVNYNGPYIANMSAIDTQSGAQFLAKNKQAVWATYQSANRSIPVTR
jgi:lambda family phage tail tape measure protein